MPYLREYTHCHDYEPHEEHLMYVDGNVYTYCIGVDEEVS